MFVTEFINFVTIPSTFGHTSTISDSVNYFKNLVDFVPDLVNFVMTVNFATDLFNLAMMPIKYVIPSSTST
jgi:hypothetical protein